MEAPVETWGEGRSGVVLTDNVNGAEDGGCRDESEPWGDIIGVGLYGDGDGISGVVVFIVCCLSQAYAFESEGDAVLRWDCFKELDEGKLLWVWVGGGGGVICEANK